jgi:muramoyltetrapeptide carboxypeptidase
LYGRPLPDSFRRAPWQTARMPPRTPDRPADTASRAAPASRTRAASRAAATAPAATTPAATTPAATTPTATTPAATTPAATTPATPQPATARGPSVYLISPSGAVADPDRARRAAGVLDALGHPARFDPAALRRSQRFAGTDEARAAAFERAAAQDAPIVMITRGGYGLTRLLPRLDFRRLARADKRWVGLSDFTAFHLAMLARARAVTWAGPALLDDFAVESPDAVDPTTLGAFREAMSGELEMLGFRAAGASGVDERGTLWGGNLSVLCALLGTPWFPKVKGGILFVEDVNEHPYRIERMLLQLLQAGVLDAQRAVLVGYVNRYALAPHDRGYDLPAALKWLRTQTRTPIVTGLPFGHDRPKLTLPHGATVGFATEGRTGWLVFDHDH